MTASASPAPVDLELPKFTFDTSQDLDPALKAMGMTSVFDPNSADLSGVPAKAEPLFVFLIRDTVTDQVLFLGQVSYPRG